MQQVRAANPPRAPITKGIGEHLSSCLPKEGLQTRSRTPGCKFSTCTPLFRIIYAASIGPIWLNLLKIAVSTGL
jgi:hypothetical protein